MLSRLSVILTAALLLGLTAAASHSQVVDSAAPGVSLRVGMNWTRFLSDPEPPDGQVLTFERGYHFSLHREAPTKYGALTVGVGYEQRVGGLKIDDEIVDEYYGYSYRVTGEAQNKFTYLTLPIGVQFENRKKIEGRGFFVLRLVPSLLLEARGKSKFRVVDEYGDVLFSGSGSENIKDDISQFDLVTEAELGYSMPYGDQGPGGGSRLLFGASVGYGLFNLSDPEEEEEDYYDEEEEEDATFHSLVLRAFVGIAF